MALWPALYGRGKRQLKGTAFSVYPGYKRILLIYKTLDVYGFSYGAENTTHCCPLTWHPGFHMFLRSSVARSCELLANRSSRKFLDKSLAPSPKVKVVANWLMGTTSSTPNGPIFVSTIWIVVLGLSAERVA